MKKSSFACLLAGIFLFSLGGAAQAALIGVTDGSADGVNEIIAAPDMVLNADRANLYQEGFDEQQNVLLVDNLLIDYLGSGNHIVAGTTVSSHMIFLNKPNEVGGQIQDFGVIWEFDGAILGVMSDYVGALENWSTPILGSLTTTYPENTWIARGIEGWGLDLYTINGNELTVNMAVNQPGDWIRVITQASSVPVPEPATMLLLGSGLIGMVVSKKRKMMKDSSDA